MHGSVNLTMPYTYQFAGKLDEATMDMMGKPRCGMPDVKKDNMQKRRKRRFALEGSRWNNNQPITWKITQFTPRFEPS